MPLLHLDAPPRSLRVEKCALALLLAEAARDNPFRVFHQCPSGRKHLPYSCAMVTGRSDDASAIRAESRRRECSSMALQVSNLPPGCTLEEWRVLRSPDPAGTVGMSRQNTRSGKVEFAIICRALLIFKNSKLLAVQIPYPQRAVRGCGDDP